MLKPQISVELPAKNAYNYPIYIGQNLLDEYTDWLSPLIPGKKIVIITDEVVCKLHARNFAAILEKSGYDVLLLSFAPGEESKSYDKFVYLLDEMLKHKCDRHSLCIAFGGGVVGDITGFVAACFMRGIKYIQIPTTALSMIDSSVGGKTAINSEHGKNLIGAFYQPVAVIMDTNLIDSLPKDQLINGLIEAIKIFLTSDSEYFNYTLTNLGDIVSKDYTKLTKVIQRAVELKADVVAKDEKEENLRMILNCGHTIGHAIEKLSEYKMAHGYAVALGILVEAKISFLSGLLNHEQYVLIEQILTKLDITAKHLKHFKASDIVAATLIDKKNKAGNIYMILLASIGKVSQSHDGKFATIIAPDIIFQALSTFGL
ncbi:MAG: aroB [Burkholderiales bacterium]|jgi:3-dehydroquinate synthase|nr:aroB [Burkholderiales bacterium]